MSTEPYIGEIKIFGFDFAPEGHLNCNGQQMLISQYTALYALLGTTYGGDGINTFSLPDLRGRAAINQGESPTLPFYPIGARSGTNVVTLSNLNMPAHKHTLNNAQVQLNVSSGTADEASPQGNFLAMPASAIYSESGGTPGVFLGGTHMNGKTDIVGSNIPINITNPYLTVNFCIVIDGLFPPRS
jgi:microcystin-dependent protein